MPTKYPWDNQPTTQLNTNAPVKYPWDSVPVKTEEKAIEVAPAVPTKQISGRRLEDIDGDIRPRINESKTLVGNFLPREVEVAKTPNPLKPLGKLVLNTLSTVNSVLQTPATMGKYGTQEMNKAKAEGKSPIGGLLKGYGTGLGKAITNQDAVENTGVIEGIAPKTTTALKQKFPNAYNATSTIVNLFGVDDLTAWGLLGDIAKARKLSEGINTTADLVKMSQAGIKDAEKVAKTMQNPDIAKAVDSIPQKELDDIMYVDPYGNVRKTPGMDLQLEAPQKANLPKAKNIKTALQNVEVPATIQSKGKAYGIKNTALAKAEAEYDNAIKEIQNYYGDTYITSEELKKAGKGLGIDFDQLLKNIDDAQMPDIRRIGETERLKATSGLKALPDLSKTKTVPQQVKLNKGIQSALNKPQIAPSKNIDAPFKLTPAENARITNTGAKNTLLDSLTNRNAVGSPTMNQNIAEGINTLPNIKKPSIGQMKGQELLNVDFNSVDDAADLHYSVKNLEKYKTDLQTKINSATPKELPQIQSELQKIDLQLFAAKEKLDKFIKRGFLPDEELNKVLESAEGWKDKSTISYSRETFERNLEDIAGKDADTIKKIYSDPIKKAETEKVRFKNAIRNEIKNYGIKIKSADDKLLVEFGEGKISLDELKQKTNNWENIVKAEEKIRPVYNDLLNKMNVSLIANGYDPIPKRKDYFKHGQEINDLFNMVGLPFQEDKLPTDINGITATFKPGKNFFNSALKRKGDANSLGGLEGLDKYIEGASNIIYHTDNIQRLRQLDKAVRGKYGSEGVSKSIADIKASDIPEELKTEQINKLIERGNKHLSNFAANLTEYTNLLAGKKSQFDRSFESVFGRGVYTVMNTLKKQFGKNMVGANISSALTNFIPITQSLATTRKDSFVKGMAETMASVLKNDGFVEKSDFLTRRVGSDPLALSVWEKASNKMGWMFKVIDNFTAQTIVRSKYDEGIKDGLSAIDAMKKADEWAGKVMSDRTSGSVPNLLNVKTLGFLTQFQNEINNSMSFMAKDIPRAFNKKQTAGALAQLMVYGFIFNELFEKATSRRPAFDPIGIVTKTYENYNNPDVSKAKTRKEFVQQVVDQLPFSSIMTGGRIPVGSAIPNLYDVATGESTIKDESKKLLKLISPVGGGAQAQKTYEGTKTLLEDLPGIYGTNPDGEKYLKYPVDKNTGNMLRAIMFGKSAFPETNEYYLTETKALSPEQTNLLVKLITEGKDTKSAYDTIMLKRKINSLNSLISSSKKGGLTDKEKKNIDQSIASIRALVEQLKK